ncbi:MAG: GNAT family N-acetyltransferase [Eubacteriales bacterium]|nr:GNAT family N-acetyltransferase [Eubacteriales bacterium]
MFVKTQRADLERVIAFLRREELRNHYMLADLFWFGAAHPLIDLYHQEETDGVRAVLMRFGGGFTVYAPGEFDAAGAAHVMQRYRFSQLAGDTPAVQAVMACLPPPIEVRHQHFGVWHPSAAQEAPCEVPLIWVDGSNARVLAPAMARMRRDIREFSHPLSVEQTVAQCERGSQRAVIAVRGNRVASIAMTSGELPRTAMIVSVCTHPDFRGQGCAPAAVDALCRRLAGEDRQPVLFWETEQAARMYARLGFRPQGEWRIVRYAPQN